MDTNEKNIYLAILIGAIFISAILIYFLYTVLKQHKLKQELQEANMQHLLKSIEDERCRISNDLHDEINPLMSAIKFNMTSLKISNQDEKTIIDTTNHVIDDVISSLKTISLDLMPVMLIRNKVIKAIEQYVDEVNSRKQLNIVFTKTNENEIDQSIGIHLFRIIQEIIQNTIKHSQSDSLFIHLKTDSSVVELETQDTGVGFDQTNIFSEGKRKGLQSIKLRSELLKGTCEINSIPDKGTKFKINIPIVQKV